MRIKIICLTALVFFLTYSSKAQEGLPIYTDYLTDNYYLIHPSMAGVANCAKVRLTARQQWFGQEDAPSLQTLSINGRIGESPVGLGGIVFNDSNGYHSTVGFMATFAYHLLMSRNTISTSCLFKKVFASIAALKVATNSTLGSLLKKLVMIFCAGISSSIMTQE